MPFESLYGDITRIEVDAIVNAANTQLQMGSGVCGAIFHAAGAKQMQAACDSLSPIETGEAVITSGFNLPSRFVIHTAGPIYKDGNSGEEALLRACYRNALNLARENGCRSVAFPLISSGIYGYPPEAALEVAISEIEKNIAQDDLRVLLVLYGRA